MKMKLNWKSTAKMITPAMVVVLTACSPGFKTADVIGSGDSKNSGSGSTTTPSDGRSSQAWQDLQLDGQVSGGPFGKVQVISIDKATKELVVRFPMPTITVFGSTQVSIPVPQIPGGSLRAETQSDGTEALVMRIPLRQLLDGIKTLDPSKLPNGDPIPGVPDGELPSFAVNLAKSKVNATFYLAPTVFAIYINTPFASPFELTLPIRNATRTRTEGYISILPAKAPSKEGGLFLSFKLPDDLARIIDDNI